MGTTQEVPWSKKDAFLWNVFLPTRSISFLNLVIKVAWSVILSYACWGTIFGFEQRCDN